MPAGGKASNKKIREWGEKPGFDYDSRDHVELAERLTLIDYRRGTKLGGSGFWMYRGRGALMEWGLLNYFIEQHVRDGYEFILPPHILNYQCGYTAGQFPKFVDDVFLVEDKSGGQPQFLLPTSETALVNVHRDEILRESDLPKKYFSFTPCYRREIGSYRSEERGTIRGHQFNKVEMFQLTTPEQSADALTELWERPNSWFRGWDCTTKCRCWRRKTSARRWRRLSTWKYGCRAWKPIGRSALYPMRATIKQEEETYGIGKRTPRERPSFTP